MVGPAASAILYVTGPRSHGNYSSGSCMQRVPMATIVPVQRAAMATIV